MTKNGRGKYVVIDIEEYESTRATIKLLSELSLGEKSGEEKGWLSIDAIEKSLGIA